MPKVECGEVRRVFFNPVNNVLYLEVREGGRERVDYSFEVGDGVMLVLLKDVMGRKSGILRRIQGWIGETV